VYETRTRAFLTFSKRVVVVGASVSSSEIIHEILPHVQVPVIASLRGPPIPAFGLVPWTHPQIIIKKQITQFDAESGRIYFEDGGFVDDVDHLIFGTGYTFSLPYIPVVQERISKAYRRLPGVYQHTWNIDDPTLTFVGMVSSLDLLSIETALTHQIARWRLHFQGIRMASRCRGTPSGRSC
jgi:hypothetical protein